jgi:D-glycero-D-manno-heptose 1,7-bisphosphate phosphatase
MLLDAAARHCIDLKGSFVIGDRMMDVELAHNVGAKAVLVPESGDQYDVGSEMMRSEEKPEFQTDSFAEAVDWILRLT